MTTIAILLAACLALAGCSSVGHEMNLAQTQQIQKGVTTKAEMLRMFGAPMSSSGNSDGTSTAMWLYSHASSSARNFIPIVNLVSMKIDTKNQMLSVVFDEKDVVASYNFSEGGSPITAGMVR